MIVIHIDTMHDTKDLALAYEGLNAKVLYNPSRKEIVRMLKAYPTEDLMCLGHGSGSGLFARDFYGYAIGVTDISLLKGRNIIGIWCHAKTFAETYGLKGYFTDMFISNPTECKAFGYQHTEEEVDEENIKFAKEVNRLCKEGKDLTEWVGILQEGCDMSKDWVEFNYTKMRYFDGTQEKKIVLF